MSLLPLKYSDDSMAFTLLLLTRIVSSSDKIEAKRSCRGLLLFYYTLIIISQRGIKLRTSDLNSIPPPKT